MFRFQLVMEGVAIGDTEPAILGSAMHQFANLSRLDDPRLSPTGKPSKIMSVLLTDEDIHDRALLCAAESLDRWCVRGYRYGGSVVLLAQEYQKGELAGRVYSAVVPEPRYQELIETARQYWSTSSQQ